VDHSTTDPSMTDNEWMRRCLDLARQAGENGNTPIGTIIVFPDGETVEALEEVPAGPDPFGHAEVIAVRDALRIHGRPLPERATLYTNAEPCFMCSFAIREAGITRVVIERPTPEIGGATSRYPILLAPDIPRWGPAPEVVWWRPSEED
jgi:tRNA(adenine34) deaminase